MANEKKEPASTHLVNHKMSLEALQMKVGDGDEVGVVQESLFLPGWHFLRCMYVSFSTSVMLTTLAAVF